MRPPTIDDVEAWRDLANAILIDEGHAYAMSLDEIHEFFTDPDAEPERDLRVVDDPEGDGLIAWARVEHHPSGARLERAFLDGGVHPDHVGQGLGRQILAWSLVRADEKFATTPGHLEAIVMVDRNDGDDVRRRLFERHGFADTRWFDEVQRDLDDLPGIPDLDGIEIRRWDDADIEPTRHVANSAFGDHWGSTRRSAESWRSAMIEGFGRRLDLSFVAVDPSLDPAGDTGNVVGYTLNANYPEDTPITGRTDGWVDSLGTLRSHRGRGIASALLVHSFHAFADAGFDSTMLGVDADNPTGAYGLYERLGYRPIKRQIVSVRTVRPGGPSESGSPD